jgi:hypothetical protein
MMRMMTITMPFTTTTNQTKQEEDNAKIPTKTTTSNSNRIRSSSRRRSIDPVNCVRDEAWFQQQASKGCCPYAKFFYEHRYANVGHRCCHEKWWNNNTTSINPTTTMMDPLRPAGGLEFDEFLMEFLLPFLNDDPTENNMKRDFSILLQGDSLAEQHFISMLCLAWSSSLPISIHLDGVDPRKWLNGNYKTRLQWANQLNMTINFLRVDVPKLAPASLLVNSGDDEARRGDHNGNYLQEPDVVILGGWHHGGLDQLETFLTNVTRLRSTSSSPKKSKPTIVVEALPNHFPGGRYRGDQNYPQVTLDAAMNHTTMTTSSSTSIASRSQPSPSSVLPLQQQPVCDSTSFQADPNINGILRYLLKYNNDNGTTAAANGKNRRMMSLLRVEHLFHHRGNAHVGWIPKGTVGPQGRDCLHYCMAPGVVESIAKQTLGHIATTMMMLAESAEEEEDEDEERT